MQYRSELHHGRGLHLEHVHRGKLSAELCPSCGDGQACHLSGDCASGVCVGGKCRPALGY